MNEDTNDFFGVMDDDADFGELNGDMSDVFGSDEDGDDEAPAIPATAGTSIKEPNAETKEAIEEMRGQEAEAKPSTESKPKPKPKKPRKKPTTRKPIAQLSPRDKAIRVIKRRAGVDELPELDQLLCNKGGKTMRICDIGLFIGTPDDEVLADIASECPVKNRVNLSAEVQLSQVKKVGGSILSSNRMYQPIQVAQIEEDGALECTSGRHRLAFLALLYGPKASIKVYVESMTLQEARDAVVVANMARPTKALERAEHTVLQAVHGDVNAVQDELYKNTATTKNKVKKYCVYSVLKKGYPAKLGFKASLTASRDGGTALTTITNVENFWGVALEWHKEMERSKFDSQLKESVEFLNALADEFQKSSNFDCQQHMASQTLTAIGKYYADLQSVTGDAVSKVADIAKAIVLMGDIARYKSEVVYSELAAALRK